MNRADSPDDTQRLERRIEELQTELRRSQAEALQLRARLEQAREELRQTNRLIDTAPLPVLMVDESGRITDANEAAERLVGRSEEQLLGLPVDQIVSESNLARWRDCLAQVFAGKVVRGVEHILGSHSGDAKVILYPTRDADGRVVGAVMTEDVEELKDSRSTLEDINSELRDLVNRDPLTQVANRRAYENALRREISRCARRGVPLALLMIDIDHFKEFNDRLGHAAGDVCLRRVGKVLRDCLLRPGDLLARYGGEEFVAMLPETDVSGAGDVASRMRTAVAGLGIEHPMTGRPVSVSLGVAAAIPKPGDSIHRLGERADRALYRAKAGGRDRVAIAMDRPDDGHASDTGNGPKAEVQN